ncbi:MAG: hypothetical protein JXR89_09060 [Deltaproteobacteria bacterium]|nr:hypothetical protein [Deltaproteobacteria bacterium]
MGFFKLCSGIFLLFCLVFFSGGTVRNVLAAEHAVSGLHVYLAKGKGAVTILDDESYQNVFKGIFAAHHLILDTDSGADSFLGRLFAADMVYLSMHSNPNLLQVGNGEHVYVADVSRRFREVGHGPGLIIVVGCKTLGNPDNNLARALRIEPGDRGRAYIGFSTVTPGLFCDRYFRVFLAAWFKEKTDKNYRTLEEARDFARKFIEDRIEQGNTGQGEVGKFAPLDAKVAGWFEIIGDRSLCLSDLQRSGTDSDPSPASEPEPGSSSAPGRREWRSAW